MPESIDKQEEAMMQIRGHFVASRRPGELGVHSVDSFHLVVPGLEQAKDFYSAFGLDAKTVGNRLDMYTHGSSHRWGTIGEAPRKQLSYLSFVWRFESMMWRRMATPSTEPRSAKRKQVGRSVLSLRSKPVRHSTISAPDRQEG